MHILRQTSACLIAAVASIGCAQAVIVAGASGGGDNSNNTTAAEFLTDNGISLPVFSNVVQYANGSGIYLGYNSSTRDVWVMTARHINPSGAETIAIDGLNYDRQDTTDVGGDITLVRYRRGDNQVPGLTALTLSSTIPTANTSLVMIGYGRNRVENGALNAGDNDSTSTTAGTGYHWSGSRVMRWGTNVVEGEFLDSLESTGPQTGVIGNFNMGSYDSAGFMTDFDQPGGGQWLSSNEGQGSTGDSGGGIFIYQGGQWVLSGIMSAVAGFDGQDANSSAFGNYTMITDISSYRTAIDTALGTTLIPEPSVAVLLASLGGVALLRRSRKRKM